MGKVEQGFSLDGKDDSVLVSQTPVTDNEITFGAWIKPVTLANHPAGSAVFEKGIARENRAGLQILENGSLCGYLNSGTFNVCSESNLIPAGKFTFVAMTLSNTIHEMRLYANGVLVAQTSGSDALHVGNGPFVIGHSGTNGVYDNFEGVIDEVEMFDRALSVQEVATIFNTDSSGECKVPTPLSVVSRKSHGGTGDFDINLPLSSIPAVECRAAGILNDYQMVVTFAGPISVNGKPQAEIVSGNAAVGRVGADNVGAVEINGNVVTIPLTGVTNEQTITVTLNDVSNGRVSGNIAIPMSILVGDTSGNRSVTAGDVAQTKSRIGQSVDSKNFRADIDANGTIDAADAALVQSGLGTSVP